MATSIAVEEAANNKEQSQNSEVDSAQPFLKWAGSKRKLLRQILPYVPTDFSHYYEPFLGGGSLFFHLGAKSATLSDVSKDLIATYKSVRDDVGAVIRYLKPLRVSKTRYYAIRAANARGRHQRAAHFIYLNKTCWNGLYRVNLDGIFNVPFGQPRTKTVFNEENLRRCARLLGSEFVSVAAQDFETTLAGVEKGDFVYLDPPYVTAHNYNGFLEWNEQIFSWQDQIRLAHLAAEAVKKGANVLISNADHAEVRSLFSAFTFRRIHRQSTLASNADFRTRVSESLFFAGPHYE